MWSHIGWFQCWFPGHFSKVKFIFLITHGIKLAFLGEQHIPQSLDSQPSRSIVRSYAIIPKPTNLIPVVLTYSENCSSSDGRAPWLQPGCRGFKSHLQLFLECSIELRFNLVFC